MWIGQEGREVYKTFTWEEGDTDDHEKVLKKFEDYISPKKNKRVARFRAQQRKQKEGESFDMYVKDLKLLVMDCDYTDPNDILIDLIINGVKHTKVQERLLNQGKELELDKAIEIGQQFELAQSQMKIMRGEEVLSVNSNNHRYKHVHKQNYHKATPNTNKFPQADSKHKTPSHSSSKIDCRNCGTTHNKGSCPAKGSICNYCKKPNHWIKVCKKRLKKVSSIQDVDPEDLDPLHIHTTQESETIVNMIGNDKWNIRLQIGGKDVMCRIDTGAKCSILTKYELDHLHCKTVLNKSTRTLKSFSNHIITQVGATSLIVMHKGKSRNVEFQIVDISQENIISGDAAEELGLIQRVNSLSEEPKLQSSESAHELFREYPDLVKTTGTLPGEHTINIDESVPGVVHAVRKLPAAIKPRAIEKLNEMEKDGYITRVDQPTEWVSSMVVSLRKDKVRVCLDPKELNKAIKREHHPMKTIEEVVQSIPDAKVFSVLDAKSGFLQIKLDTKSSYLTTFNTPVGRYRWLRLPFGIKSAPEIYQRIMDDMIAGINGSFAIIDDILIAGKNVEEHDRILKQVVMRATNHNLKLNFNKCLIRQPRVTYMGHLVTEHGLLPDPEKVNAITNMPPPTDKEGVRRLLGLVQYLAKFIPNLSEVDAPIRVLLKSDVEFEWGHTQEKSFKELKRLCSSHPVLAYFDFNKGVQIECDASKDGLGAVIMQGDKVIAYASRALTDTEQRYAQIEKEMLSIVFSCGKFHNYIFGKPVKVFNDHKPLEQLFGKPLLSAPMRIQKMMLRLQWYDIDVKYQNGKEMHVSDALSRAYVPNTVKDDDTDDMIQMISVSTEKYAEIKEVTQAELCILQSVILKSWPDTRSETPVETRPYWDSRDQLSVLDGIIYKGLRIVIPPSLRDSMLRLIHKTHLGMGKSKQRAREVMYWPSMNSDIDTLISNCSVCAEHQNQQPAEPLKPTATPDLPYSMVGCDLFQFESVHYVILVDYYSKYIDVQKLTSESTSSVIEAVKRVFSCHGLPNTLRSDNGPQFSSAEFKDFCREHGIEHETSSPHFQSSNGEAERAVQTVKRLWSKTKDHNLALLDYRTTPLEGINSSPAQLLMGRRPRNLLPAAKEVLKPSQVEHQKVKRHFDHEKVKQKFYFDKRNGVKEQTVIKPGSDVRIQPNPNSRTNNWTPGTVIRTYDKPRSYVVESGDRQYRRNRRHLRLTTQQANESKTSDNVEFEPTVEIREKPPDAMEQAKPDTSGLKTRSGRVIKAPDRLDL